jgi:hypothetical protein
LLFALPAAHQAEAEACFRKAIAIARSQSAKLSCWMFLSPHIDARRLERSLRLLTKKLPTCAQATSD